MDVTLQSNEGIINYYEGIIYVNNGKRVRGTLYVTNLQLIFIISKGVINKQYIEYKFPYNQIKVIDGKAQIVVKENRTKQKAELTICMVQSQEEFEFDWPQRKTSYIIADEILKQLTCSLYDKSLSKKESIAYKAGNLIKQGVSSFAEGLFSVEKKPVTKKCKVCKAEIKGFKDEEVTCKFCGNTQKI